MAKTPGKSVKLLTTWFERQKRVLPWRDQPTLYRVWISEMMLQQTQVVTVIPYFERWMERFPSLAELARADESEVLKFWSGLGYYSRARNILRAAKGMQAQGGFPNTKAQWLEIPGVGPYTAGAIVSIALGQPEPILDGNVERVLSRVYRVDRKSGDAPFKRILWAQAKAWVETAHSRGISPSALNQGMMELGALVCTAKNPKCGECPIRTECAAFRAGEVELFPPKRARAKFMEVQEQVLCRIRARAGGISEIFLRQRQKGEWCPDLWDFPVLTETVPRAESRNAPQVNYVITRHKIRRTLIVRDGKTAMKGEGAWLTLAQVRDLPVGSALVKSLKKLGLAHNP